MLVRPVRPEDREEWLRLLGSLYPGHAVEEHARSVDAFLEKQPHEELLPSEVFVCERAGDGLAGILELSVRDYAEGCAGATPYVESWYVDPDVRGEGVGHDLIAAAEAWARDRGYAEIASDTGIDNVASQAAHAALGFEEVERTVHFRKSL